MSHACRRLFKSCLLSKLNDGLSQLRSAEDEAVARLASYGSSCTRKNKKCSRSPGINLVIEIAYRNMCQTWRFLIRGGA